MSPFSFTEVELIVTQRTFVHSWHHQLKIHEGVAENRLRFAARLVEMSDELGGLIKEVEKNRKTVSVG